MRLKKLIEYSLFTRRCEICGSVVEFNRARCEECEELKRITGCVIDDEMKYSALVSSYFYDDESVRRAVARFKYRGFKALASSLAGEMIKSVEENYSDVSFDYVTYVPMTLWKKRKRGYNQTELLAKEIAGRMNVPCKCLLKKIKKTKAQQGSTSAERKKNLSGAFDLCVYEETIKGKTILLVDDVKTTGSTLNECSKILKKNGAEKVYAVTFAMTR